MSNYSGYTRRELIAICREKKIKGYSGKNKNEIIKLLTLKDKKPSEEIEMTEFSSPKKSSTPSNTSPSAKPLSSEEESSLDTTPATSATKTDINKVIPQQIPSDKSDTSNDPSISSQSSKNKGTGAGGANTNKTGLFYENTTSLMDMYTVLSECTSEKKTSTVQYIKFNNYTQTYVYASKNDFIKYMDPDKKNEYAHGCKSPDECYIDETNKKIFIIEKKYQAVSGSVCEKIQSGPFKQWHFTRIFPEYRIIYMYCLNDWFKTHCKVELEYLKEHSIPIFWGDSSSYKTDIVDFICKHS